MNRSCDKFYTKMDKDQKAYYDSIFSNIVTCCNARAGTGKTTIATVAAFEMLSQGKISKIVYIRFPDELTQSLGAFPGTLAEKEELYMEPFIEACAEIDISKDMIFNCYVNREEVLMCTNIGLRGVNFKDAFIILDEAQNATFNDLKLVLTRMHDDCKCVMIGHSGQIDNSISKKELAFEAYIDHLTKKSWAKLVNLNINYRGKVSAWADSLEMVGQCKYEIRK